MYTDTWVSMGDESETAARAAAFAPYRVDGKMMAAAGKGAARRIFALVALGLVHPKKVKRNSTAKPGDVLVLGKPLGVGILSAALKKGKLSEAGYRAMLDWTTRLNTPGETLAELAGVHALTDVTGFGLLGHAWEMAEGSGVALRLRVGAVPLLDGVADLAARDVVPGGSKANLAWVAPHVRFAERLSAPLRQVLADAQTNGGLLAAVEPGAAAGVLSALRAAGVEAVEVGYAAPPGPDEEPGIEVS